MVEFETIYFVERKSVNDFLCSNVLEWTITLSEEKAKNMAIKLTNEKSDADTYYEVRSMLITV